MSGVRERILVVAGELFARQGYAATSTRDIAAAVGVRQPSLFHHFASKAAIREALLRLSYGPTGDVAVALAGRPGSAAARLHAYLSWDLAYVYASDVVLHGVHEDDVLADPAHAHARKLADRLHDAQEQLIAAAVAAGEFEPVDVGGTRELLTALTLTHVRRRAEGRDGAAVSATVRFILRGLLADPRRIDEVATGSAAELAILPAPTTAAAIALPVDR